MRAKVMKDINGYYVIYPDGKRRWYEMKYDAERVCANYNEHLDMISSCVNVDMEIEL